MWCRRFIPRAGNTPRSCWPWPARTVHPHGAWGTRSGFRARWDGGGSSSRAGNTEGAGHRLVPTGSSPRAWGTRQRMTGVDDPTVHPHGRGEHNAARSMLAMLCGSSPRAWGTHRSAPRARRARRFIPRAWETDPAAPGQRRETVHPTGVGEHTCGPMKYARRIGSSPRAGNTRPCAQPRMVSGSSPRAWGTLSARSRQRLAAVHPHGRGNTNGRILNPALRPVHPHGRGEHERAHGDMMTAHRFIPTGVGNTLVGNAHEAVFEVHPHGRGETRFVPGWRAPRHRFIPRAWGTQYYNADSRYQGWFIPTGVGNTNDGAMWDYEIHGSSPRAWEHLRAASRVASSGGSSSRAWGTLYSRPRDSEIAAVHPHGRGEHPAPIK